jgi:hypothetical protein
VKTADSQGFLALKLPSKAHVVLDTSHNANAASR